MASRAKQELRDLLAGDQVAVDVVGYIAGSGGGLTRSDLSALTGAPPYKLDPILRGVFGRSLHARASTDPRNAPGRSGDAGVLVRTRDFAGHRRGTTRQRARPLPAKRCTNGSTPTPAPAGRTPPRATPSAATLACSRLRSTSRGCPPSPGAPADTRFSCVPPEATTPLSPRSGLLRASSRIKSVLDLQALVELAVYRHAISIRNQSVPADLPVVWARLGRFDHAEALVRAITDPKARPAPWPSWPPRSRRLATPTVPRPWPAPSPTGRSASGARRSGHRGRARLATRPGRGPGPRHHRPRHPGIALSDLATAAAQAGDTDRAEALARAITDPGTQARALTTLATAAAQAGDTRPGRGPSPRHHRPRHPGPGLSRLGHRGRPGRRPRPRPPAGHRRRGAGPRHHRPLRPGTRRSATWPPRPRKPATPPRPPAGHRRRGAGPHHRRP